MNVDGKEVSDLIDGTAAPMQEVQVKTEMGGTESPNSSKVCSVCGDLALGFNFNALTCESCKAFFRRNALKAKEFKCPFTENCVMTAITRRFCQRCRLQKCFSVGMRKEYIMSEEERLNKRNKIEQNRARKRAAGQVLGSSVSSKRNRSSGKGNGHSSECSGSVSDWNIVRTPESHGSPACSNLQAMSPPQVSEPSSERLLEPFPSPTTASSAASVPSPSSPPDSATVAASHNTEMILKQEEAIINKQSMISVITYPHHVTSNSIQDFQRHEHRDHQRVHTVSTSTQTTTSNPSPKTYNTASTQTLPESQQSNPTQLTPLLTSLISSQRSEECINTHQEASTSPLPPPYDDGKNIDDGTGGWTGVDGVHSATAWDSCISMHWSPDQETTHDLQDVLRIPAVHNSFESILSEAIKLEFSAYTPTTLSSPHLNPISLALSKELNDAERAKLNELIVANKALLAPLDETTTDHSPALLDIINLTAVAIRRLVKMAKKINAFKNMCQEDQVALLKGACMEMLILHSAMTYNPDRDSWDIPHSTNSRLTNISVDVLKEARGNLYQEHRRFQRTFDPRWRADENIMLILTAIALFTPNRPRIVHHDVIKLEQNSYFYLLRRYLECNLPGCEARSTFLKLIHKVSELHRLNEEHVRAYLDVDPSEVEPLLIEIFDLKPPTVTL